MQRENFTVTILVDQTPAEVFKAINKVGEWWIGEPGVEGNTEKAGDEFTYRYLDIHYSRQKITELVPGKKIVWMVTDSQLGFIKNKNEWTGTQICFEISKKKDKTQIQFTHHGLVPAKECYKDCSGAWSSYITGSLKKFILNANF